MIVDVNMLLVWGKARLHFAVMSCGGLIKLQAVADEGEMSEVCSLTLKRSSKLMP